MEKEDKKLPAGVTAEQVQQFVNRHKQVFPVRVPKDGQTYVGLFRKPKLSDMSAAAAIGQGDPIGAGELLYNQCKLACDPEMDSDDEVRMAAINGVSKIFRVLEAEVGEAYGAGQ